jgi:hypothetical protein
MEILKNLKLFISGSLEEERTKARAKELEFCFLTLIFSDMLGIPNPYLPFIIDLIPCTGKKFRWWTQKLAEHKSVIFHKSGEIGEVL